MKVHFLILWNKKLYTILLFLFYEGEATSQLLEMLENEVLLGSLERLFDRNLNRKCFLVLILANMVGKVREGNIILLDVILNLLGEYYGNLLTYKTPIATWKLLYGFFTFTCILKSVDFLAVHDLNRLQYAKSLFSICYVCIPSTKGCSKGKRREACRIIKRSTPSVCAREQAGFHSSCWRGSCKALQCRSLVVWVYLSMCAFSIKAAI